LLVTGVPGFVGWAVWRHWQDACPETEVFTASHLPCPADLPTERHFQVDLRDRPPVGEMVGACKPNQVIHLAGLVTGADLADMLAVNVVGTANLYDALCESGRLADLRVVQAGSAAAYGMIRPDELPITESQPFRPLSDYGLSKAAQDQFAAAMAQRQGLPVIRARVFNLFGPGQGDNLVPMTFIRQLKDAGAAGETTLKVGDVDTRRDFVDVRDVAGALAALMERGQPGEAYNVASGKDVSIREVIEQIIQLSGVEAALEVDTSRLRKTDVPCVRADISAIEAATSWRPAIDLAASLKDMCRGDLPRSA